MEQTSIIQLEFTRNNKIEHTVSPLLVKTDTSWTIFTSLCPVLYISLWSLTIMYASSEINGSSFFGMASVFTFT